MSLLALVAALANEFLKKSPTPQLLEHLAAFVASHGKLAPFDPAAAKVFRIPRERVVFTRCIVVSDSGKMRAIGVHFAARVELHRHPAHRYANDRGRVLLFNIASRQTLELGLRRHSTT